jgi:hypothetical protein
MFGSCPPTLLWQRAQCAPMEAHAPPSPSAAWPMSAMPHPTQGRSETPRAKLPPNQPRRCLYERRSASAGHFAGAAHCARMGTKVRRCAKHLSTHPGINPRFPLQSPGLPATLPALLQTQNPARACARAPTPHDSASKLFGQASTQSALGPSPRTLGALAHAQSPCLTAPPRISYHQAHASRDQQAVHLRQSAEPRAAWPHARCMLTPAERPPPALAPSLRPASDPSSDPAAATLASGGRPVACAQHAGSGGTPGAASWRAVVRGN